MHLGCTLPALDVFLAWSLSFEIQIIVFLQSIPRHMKSQSLGNIGYLIWDIMCNVTANVTQGEEFVHWTTASVLRLVPWISDLTHHTVQSLLHLLQLAYWQLFSFLSSQFLILLGICQDILFLPVTNGIFIFVKYKRKCAVFKVFFFSFSF